MEFSKYIIKLGTLFMINISVRPSLELGARFRLWEKFVLSTNFFGFSFFVEVEPLERIAMDSERGEK